MELLNSPLAPPAFRARLPWLFPEPPLHHFSRALCLLSDPQRLNVSRLFMRLEMKAEEYFLLRDVAAGSTASLEAEVELFRTLLVRDQLSKCVVCAQLRAPEPSTPEEVERFNAHY